ncbi:MAG: hypothetical protein KAW17_11105, partial [Candidatus Eisenbacteria sp.]|nr:hypothetical protein [Candidatus Eisenbacteria bacterium]
MRRRKTRIVCTMGPMEDERIPSTVQEFIQAGMDVARINMAHYDVSDKSQREYLHKLLVAIRRKAEECGEQVAIMGDIQGPKVRIRRFLGSLSGQSQVRLEKDEEFVLTMESDENIIDASDKGASVSYEGDFHFFNQISENVSDEENGEPGDIELWFADGKVIIKTSVSQIEPTHARCKVVVPGELKERQGITVKGSTIKPEHYNLADYPKDGADIVFLLREGVDLFALSFVNSAQDIMNMQAYIRGKVNELGLGLIRKRFLGMRDVPIIAKIETAEGVARLDEIMDACFGVMVARGDLALRTGIANIGILQKQIIDRCATKAKPVITATQMLLSMMDFREPRRPEVTDVTNAIFDGTDALMLSEETGDPSSLFPREAISTMARIAVKTEEEIRERNRIEYRNKITERHERAKDVLRENERKVDEARTLG